MKFPKEFSPQADTEGRSPLARASLRFNTGAHRIRLNKVSPMQLPKARSCSNKLPMINRARNLDVQCVCADTTLFGANGPASYLEKVQISDES